MWLKFCSVLLFLFSIAGVGFCQGIHYEPTFKKALEKAAETGKPIFLTIEPPFKAMENAVTPALYNKDVADIYDQKFISYKVSIDDTTSIALREKYDAHKRFPAYIFLDNKGSMVYKGYGVTRNPRIYKLFADIAEAGINNGLTVDSLNRRYLTAKRTPQFFYNYIAERVKLGIPGNEKLLEEYVNTLNMKALSDYYTVLFILKAGPQASGKVYNLIHDSNSNLIDSIFKTESPFVRKEINDAIISNTLADAIAEKSEPLARKASTFAFNSRKKDFKRAYSSQQNIMLDYYKAINDTAKFYNTAIPYYKTYMSVSVDSVRKQQKESKENKSLAKADTSSTKMSTMVYEIKSDCDCEVPRVLNTGAWNLYSLGTNNPEYLTQAVLWSRRAILLEPQEPEYYDTLAHVLYRLGLYNEALHTENQALTLADKVNLKGPKLIYMQTDYKKMKQKKL